MNEIKMAIKTFFVFVILMACCSCTSFITKKMYVSSCIDKEENFCWVDKSLNLHYAVAPFFINRFDDSLFYEITITSPTSMLLDSFNVSLFYENLLIEAHLVDKETNNSLVVSDWKFAWKKHTRKNFWKSHYLIIEPAVIRDEKVERFPPNEFRWQKKNK